MRQKQKGLRWLFSIVVLFSSLTLFSTYLVSGMYARYTTSADGSDSARVAKFSVSESFHGDQTFSLALYPGQSATYRVEIENNSEVAVQYQAAAVNVTNNLPLTLTFDGGTNTRSGNLAIGAENASFDLTVAWPTTETGTKNYTYNREVEMITITLTCSQMD